MKYRTLFMLGTGLYYTEWFDTRGEVDTFVHDAQDDGVDVRWIENEDGDVL